MQVGVEIEVFCRQCKISLRHKLAGHGLFIAIKALVSLSRSSAKTLIRVQTTLGATSVLTSTRTEVKISISTISDIRT